MQISSNRFALYLTCLALGLFISACSSSKDAEVASAPQPRSLTAPIQQDIQKAQQASSLLELYENAPTRKDNFSDIHPTEGVKTFEKNLDDPIPAELPQAAPVQEISSIDDVSTTTREDISTIPDVQASAPPVQQPMTEEKAIETVIAEQTATPTAPEENVVYTDDEKGAPLKNTPEIRDHVAKVQENVESYQPAPESLDSPVSDAYSSVAPTASTQPYVDNSPLLNAGETMRVTVFNDPDLTGEYEINTQGFITMPLLGDIRAAGVTQTAFKNQLEYNLAANGILVEPKVSIEVISLRPFYILGEVRNPGDYPTVPNMDVFKALAIAGGLTPRAVDDKFIIYRGHGADRKEIAAREDTPVLPGDSIKVKERFF